MSDRPTIHLTNAASRKPPHRGPGRVWTIMARPRAHYGETGEGSVDSLVPEWAWVHAVRAGEMPMAEYRERYMAQLGQSDLAPGNLLARTYTCDSCGGSGDSRSKPGVFCVYCKGRGYGRGPVRNGATLLCACSRARAAAGECHRAWAAVVLARSGWRVVLDGVEIPEGESAATPKQEEP